MEFLNSIYGGFFGPYVTYFVWASIITILFVGFRGLPLQVWTAVLGVVLVGFAAPTWLLAVFLAWAVLFNIRPLRQKILTTPVMNLMKSMGFLPQISPTERIALEAGVVWIEQDLFSGKPDFHKVMEEPFPELTAEEIAFINGPVEEFCEMISDWDLWNEKDLRPEAWQFLKDNKFFGMVIPKEYGGLGFSAYAHSEVISKLATRSVPACVTVMVPNSLGPAELISHYGTDKQKQEMLPRLANGQDIPCFALTEPQAGSDAGSITSEGVVFKSEDGKLYIRMNWNKRWITLAAVSDVIGMAFKLRDPENHLGQGEDLGITLALIPSKSPGVTLGMRHDPLGCPFYNCPTYGKDVVISVDNIIGGVERAGKGWKMLMESLGAGRGISLPAQSHGGISLAMRLTSNHSIIRKQFGLSIGKFEGIEEPLSRINGFGYMLDSFRRFTLGALDKGVRPPVITAIAKYHSSEMGRKAVNDAMDILGGAGISRGPRNLIANTYICAPIAITVEGANILTRTLMIFGQGALRAHPFAFQEVNCLEKGDVKGFDRAFWGHIGHVINNTFRTTLLSLTRGRLASGVKGGPVGRYYKKLSWVSATFALMSDIAMGSLGGKLKQKEKITGRFADILSWMYIGTSVLRRWEADGRPKEDLPFVHYSMKHAFTEIEKAFDGIFSNITVPGLTWFFRGPIKIWSGLNSVAEDIPDDLTHKISSLMLMDSEQRDRLTSIVFYPKGEDQQLNRLERTFKLVLNAQEANRKIRRAIRKKQLPKKKVADLIELAVEKGVIDNKEAQDLKQSVEARWEAIQVDHFSLEEYKNLGNSGTKPSSGSATVNGSGDMVHKTS